jgi:hypothetical protein
VDSRNFAFFALVLPLDSISDRAEGTDAKDIRPSASEEGRGVRLGAMVGSSEVDAVAFSTNGQLVLTARRSIAILWAITGEEIWGATQSCAKRFASR